MANVLFKRGNTATINRTAIADGQLLYNTQTRTQYLDDGNTRLQIGQTVDATLNSSSNNPIANSGVAGVMHTSLSEISTITQAGNIPDALAVKELNSNFVYDSVTGYLKGYKTGADTWSPFSSIKLLGYFWGSTTPSTGGFITKTSALNNTKTTIKIFVDNSSVSSITVSSGSMVIDTTISSSVKLYKVTGMSVNSTITVTSEWGSGVGAFE